LEAEKNAEMGRNHSRGWTEPKCKIYFGLFIGSPARVLSWGRGAMGYKLCLKCLRCWTSPVLCPCMQTEFKKPFA
jgi:hypothetical protein